MGERRTFPVWLHLSLAALVFTAFCHSAWADTITFGGTITQSTPDGTGPAINNTSLNAIADGNAYTVNLTFSGLLLLVPGTYNLTGASLSFNVATALATETAFSSISLTILPDGLYSDFSLLACLSTGSFACGGGNELDSNFKILTADLHSLGVAAFGLDPPHPLDLLEDDGITDIHGSITNYSYTPAVTPAPEPSSLVFLAAGLALLGVKSRLRTRKLRLTPETHSKRSV